MSLTSPLSTPACSDAPTATASSGLTPLSASLPVSSFTRSATAGMRVEPPTRITRSISSLVRPASRMACSNGPRHESRRSAVSSWNFARLSVRSRWSGPSLVAVMNGRLTVVSCSEESSIFAFSAASFRRCDGHLVGREVDAVCVLELGDEPVDDALVPVVATEVRVAGGRLHLEHALAEVEDRHVERAATEVEHEDGLVVVLVEPVRERGRGGLVDDAQDLEARDLAGLLGGLALGVAEVGGHGDHGLGDGVAQVGLGVALELLQDPGARSPASCSSCRRCRSSSRCPCGA